VLTIDDVASMVTALNFLGNQVSNHPPGLEREESLQDITEHLKQLWWAFQWQDEVLTAPDKETRLKAYMTYVKFGTMAMSKIYDFSRRAWVLVHTISDTTWHPHSFLALVETLITTGIYSFAQSVYPVLPKSYVSTYMAGREKMYTAILEVST